MLRRAASRSSRFASAPIRLARKFDSATRVWATSAAFPKPWRCRASARS